MIGIPFKELADEKRLHLVEFREENDYFPLVVATPEHVRTKEELEPNEILDFEQVPDYHQVIALHVERWS